MKGSFQTFKKTARKLVVCDVICDYKKEDPMTLGNISKKSDSYICKEKHFILLRPSNIVCIICITNEILNL